MHEEGVKLYAKIGGYGDSSTRCELAAAIIAVCSHGPIHVGSDSKAFVDFANSLISDLKNNIEAQLETC